MIWLEWTLSWKSQVRCLIVGQGSEIGTDTSQMQSSDFLVQFF